MSKKKTYRIAMNCLNQSTREDLYWTIAYSWIENKRLKKLINLMLKCQKSSNKTFQDIFDNISNFDVKVDNFKLKETEIDKSEDLDKELKDVICKIKNKINDIEKKI